MKTQLVAESVAEDITIQTAQKQILDTILAYQKQVTDIRPPLSSMRESYANTLQRFTEYRGMPLWYPYIGSGFGNGALVELADGSVKYDFVSGIAVHWGHCHPKMIAASLNASIQNTVMQGHLQQNLDSYYLTELLLQNSGMDHCILTTSGAMACENALKLVLHKKVPASRFIAFERCFMGRTLALSQITDKPDYRQGLPLNLMIDYIPFYDWRDPEGSLNRAQTALRKVIKRYPGQHACMCFEMIQGESGYYSGTHDFFASLMSILKEHEIPVIVDEIQSFGRTDRLFAFQHFGLEEFVDVITVGKLLQVAATLFRSSFRPKPGLISQTFTGATASIHGATAILKSLLNDGYLGEHGKNMELRNHFVEKLSHIADKYPSKIEGPFGMGLLIAFTPFGGERDKVIRFAHALFEAGVIVFIAGSDPTRIRMAVPSGSVELKDIDRVSSLIEEILTKQ